MLRVFILSQFMSLAKKAQSRIYWARSVLCRKAKNPDIAASRWLCPVAKGIAMNQLLGTWLGLFSHLVP